MPDPYYVLMRDLIQDFIFGLRMLRKEPLLTAAAAVSIAVGVAANTTIFSVANRVLFHTLPIGDPSSLITISGQETKTGRAGSTLSWLDYQDLRKETSVLNDAAAYFPLVPAGLSDSSGASRRLWGQLVTGNYFDVAQVRPVLGRAFRPEEDQVPGRDFVVVLSHHVWRTHLGADPAIAGKTIRLNQRNFTVAGVAPEGFRGADLGLIADFWVPMAMQREVLSGIAADSMAHDNRNNRWVMCIGRLREGVGVDAARKALHALGVRLAEAFPDSNKDRTLHAERAGKLSILFRESVVAFLAVMLAVMAMVLLIACANVANLLLARAARRQKEIATRLAIGAGRGRLIRQLLTESLLIAAIGSGLAVLLTMWTQSLISAIDLPVPIPADFTTGLDWRVGLFTLALTLATNVAFGLAPALRSTRTDLVTALKVTTAEGFGRGKPRLTSALVVSQVAAALLLVSGAALVLRSLQNAHTVDLGFNPRNLMLVSLDPALDGLTPEQAAQALHLIRDRVQTLPGVTAASFTDLLQMSMAGQSTRIRSKPDARDTGADFFHVGGKYLEAMGIPLIEGTPEFPPPRDGARAAVVSQTLAKQLWPDGGAIGQYFSAGPNDRYYTIGVARDSKARTIGEETRPIFYTSFEQSPRKVPFFGVRLLVRTKGAPAPIAEAVRREIRAAYPNLSIFDIQPMEDHVRNAQILPRVAAALFGFAGFSALLLAVTGLFGVVNYSVSRRTREIGIRMALGAGSGNVLGMVLRQGMRLCLLGAAIGFALALAATRILSGLLYGVEPTDPVTFTIVPLLLLATGFAACLIPALRSSRLRPMLALREE